MNVYSHKLVFALALSFIFCEAVPVRKPLDKDVEMFGTDFLEEFNSLFGYDWWTKESGGSAEQHTKDVVERQPLEIKDEAQGTPSIEGFSRGKGEESAGPPELVENYNQTDSTIEELELAKRPSIEALSRDTLPILPPNNAQTASPMEPTNSEEETPVISLIETLSRDKLPLIPPENKQATVVAPVQKDHLTPNREAVAYVHDHTQPKFYEKAGTVPMLPYQNLYQGNNPLQLSVGSPQVYSPAQIQPGVLPGQLPIYTESSSQERLDQSDKLLVPPYPYHYPYPLPYYYPAASNLGLESDSSLDSFMLQPPIGPPTAPNVGPSAIPHNFIDPAVHALVDANKAMYFVPSARSYDDIAKEKYPVIDEKNADEKWTNKYDVFQTEKTDSLTASKPEARAKKTELLVRTPLDYSSLTKSLTTPQPEAEHVSEYWDEEKYIPIEVDANIPEVDETTICQTEDGLIGSCSTPTDCAIVSGLPSGPCTVPSIAGHLECCLHAARCGQKSGQLVTYLNNEFYPAATNSLPSCPISIDLLPDICQVRLDFLHFSFKPPVEEFCDPSNSISLSTTPGGTIAHQPLCGHITDTGDHLTSSVPHLYGHFNLSHSPLPYHNHQLHINIAVKDFPSTWNIRIAQIRCDLNPSNLTPLMAKPSCSQWYTATSATMDSVILLSGSKTQFRACIKPDSKACAIRYHFYSVVCNKQDKVQIIGSDVSVCGMTNEEREVIVPASNTMGVEVTPGKEQDGGASSYTVGYSLMYDCSDLQFK